MVGWDGQANWNRDVLERIVALLFALANLADLAAAAPFLRRRKVLGILCPAEAEARAFVIGPGVPTMVDTPESAGDAERLAASFRALALALCLLLAQAALSGLPGATGAQAGGRRSARRSGRHAAPSAPDTS